MLASVKNDKVKIGDNLRIVREEKRLTQEKLAEKMDVDRQTVYRMERGIIPWKHFWRQRWCWK